jgi:hypothetical protein
MKRFPLVFLLILATTIPAFAGDKWHTVEVRVNNNVGTGVPVATQDGKTLILTNAHVCPAEYADKPITVRLNDGKKLAAKWLEGSSVTETGPNSIKVNGPDLCLLAIDGTFDTVAIATDLPRPGDTVYSYGFGGSDQEPNKKTGEVRENRFTESHLVTTIATISGDSGGPVFNAKGELVGVTWGKGGGEGLHVDLVTIRHFVFRDRLKKLFPRLFGKFQLIPVATPKALPVAPAPAPAPTPATPAPPALPAPKQLAPTQQGCPNGNCGTTAAPVQRFGLFGFRRW